MIQLSGGHCIAKIGDTTQHQHPEQQQQQQQQQQFSFRDEEEQNGNCISIVLMLPTSQQSKCPLILFFSLPTKESNYAEK